MTDTTLYVLIGVAALVVIGAAAYYARQQMRSRALKRDFGPEYQAVVEQVGDQRTAERELIERQKRVERYDIRPLDPAEGQRYMSQWRDVQARFVDEPRGSIAQAQRLLELLMSARGYPIGDELQQQADLSVKYPEVTSHYREARGIAIASEEGRASTEDLRQAMIHYRALFTSLLEIEQPSQPRVVETRKEVRP